MFENFPLFKIYLVKKWALNGIEIEKSGNKWDRE